MKCPKCGNSMSFHSSGDTGRFWFCKECHKEIIVSEPNQQRETDMNEYGNNIYTAKAVRVSKETATLPKIEEVLATIEDIVAANPTEARDKAILLFGDKLANFVGTDVIISPFV